MQKKILIVNDDGIDADGIIRLARATQKYGEVTVVAPESQRSAASHSITLRTYIDVMEHDFPVEGVKAYAISGSPADCVRVALKSNLNIKPDIVFSGINYGYNAGTDVQYSATVGAAMEAVFQGVAAVAFSEGTKDGYMVTDAYLDEVIAEVIDTKFEKFRLVNVNFPTCKLSEVKGILRDVKVSEGSVYDDTYDCELEEKNMRRYRVNGRYVGTAEAGSDLDGLYNNYITIGNVYNIH